jgi:hypothetical protein
MSIDGQREFQVKLEGPASNLGEVYASDLARLLLGLEQALAAAAYQASRRPRRARTGRHQGDVERATRLRLVRIDRGSTVATLAVAPPPPEQPDQPELEFDSATLGEQALGLVMDVLEEPARKVDRELALRLADLGRTAGVGTRHDRIVLEDGPRQRRRRVVMEGAQVERFQQVATRHEVRGQTDTVIGRLMEADFDRHTARLRSSTGGRVDVFFGEEFDHAIKDALLEDRRLVGRVSYDRATSEVRRVEIENIAEPEQLMIVSFHDFDEPLDASRLIEEQGTPIFDFDAIPDLGLTDDEAEAFIRAADE